MYSYGPPHMAVQKQDDHHEHTFSNYVRIRDVVQKTCQKRWTIGKSSGRGSGISVLPARHDDDDDDNDDLLPRKKNLLFIKKDKPSPPNKTKQHKNKFPPDKMIGGYLFIQDNIHIYMFVYLFLHVCAYVCMCVCVCVWKREREREKEKTCC